MPRERRRILRSIRSRVWRAADWYEREVFDMFGITFRNHPNLVRILMPIDWDGFPLRKDYPVHGYKYSYPERIRLMKEDFRRSRSDYRAPFRRVPATPSAPRRMTLNMGPQHPSTHGVLRIVLELEGETIIAGRAGHRLPAHRHRKGVRAEELAAGGYADRPRRLSGESCE